MENFPVIMAGLYFLGTSDVNKVCCLCPIKSINAYFQITAQLLDEVILS